MRHYVHRPAEFLWLDSHLVVDGVAKFLFAAQVLIVGLKRYMSFKAMFEFVAFTSVQG